MDILISETCWAHKKWNKIASDIKLVFYSSTITMMHGPINIKNFFHVYVLLWQCFLFGYVMPFCIPNVNICFTGIQKYRMPSNPGEYVRHHVYAASVCNWAIAISGQCIFICTYTCPYSYLCCVLQEHQAEVCGVLRPPARLLTVPDPCNKRQ